jgi:hypothetical protein
MFKLIWSIWLLGASIVPVLSANPTVLLNIVYDGQNRANTGYDDASKHPFNYDETAMLVVGENQDGLSAECSALGRFVDFLAADGTIPSTVYRGGGKNPGNLTPRPVDQGMLSTRDSLSNPYPLKPGQRAPLPAGQPIQVIDTSKLPTGSVVRDGAPFGPQQAGHASIGPNVPAETVKQAIKETIPASETK